LAATIHSHEAAYMIMNGTGAPTTQPATSTFFLPKRSASPPAKRLERALTRPKVTMNEKMAVLQWLPGPVQLHDPLMIGSPVCPGSTSVWACRSSMSLSVFESMLPSVMLGPCSSSR